MERGKDVTGVNGVEQPRFDLILIDQKPLTMVACSPYLLRCIGLIDGSVHLVEVQISNERMDHALSIARELGMTPLMKRILRRREILKA